MDWDTYAEEMGPRLFRYFSASFVRELADECTQDTLLRVFQAYRSGRFDSQKGSINMWSFGIARNVRLEYSRQALKSSLRSSEFSEQLHGGKTPDVDARIDCQHMRRAMWTLSDIEREIISLLVDRDLSLAEISALVEVPIGTVKSHVHRAKEKFRELLKPKGASL